MRIPKELYLGEHIIYKPDIGLPALWRAAGDVQLLPQVQISESHMRYLCQ